MIARRIRRDERGVAVIEMALALPALIVLIWGIAQLGMVYRAMSGIQHALGEGARLAMKFSDKAKIDPEKLIDMVAAGDAAFSPSGVLKIQMSADDDAQVFAGVRQLLARLQ